jgi:hypothetical protein
MNSFKKEDADLPDNWDDEEIPNEEIPNEEIPSEEESETDEFDTQLPNLFENTAIGTPESELIKQPIQQTGPTIDEVEVKYPAGIVKGNVRQKKRNSVGGKVSTNILTIGEYDKIKKHLQDKKDDPNYDYQTELDVNNAHGDAFSKQYVFRLNEHVDKPQFTANIKGKTINIPKIEVIDRTISYINSIIKSNDFVKFSQNWSRNAFQIETLNNIKKNKIKFEGYLFNINKTLTKMNEFTLYLKQSQSFNKISITTKRKTKIDDLFFIIYTNIIYILYSYRPSQGSIGDIFEMISLLKLLKQNDEITLQYIKTNY